MIRHVIIIIGCQEITIYGKFNLIVDYQVINIKVPINPV